MKSLNVLVVTHEDFLPPADASRLTQNGAVWQTEFSLLEALKSLGHRANILGLRGELQVLRSALEEFRPDIVFNLMEEFDGVSIYDQNIVAYLELKKIPYTGCNPRGLVLARDKGLSKKILHYHRIPIPQFLVFPKNQKIKKRIKLKFPLIVKSLIEEASLGISQASVVYDQPCLEERVAFIHNKICTDALVEEYIEGRELYVGALGNSRVRVFPVWELNLEKMPEKVPRIATRRVKWDVSYQQKHSISSGPARDISQATQKKIETMVRRIYRHLGLSGYARIDFRMDKLGQVYVLEANPNPDLALVDAFSESASSAGLSYDELIGKIVKLGLGWHKDRAG